jgi:steroid 5-alpha reductase family enzyme
MKKEPGFWKSAFVKVFLPEAFALSLISLPFTLPFNGCQTTLGLGENVLNIVRAIGVGVFGAGFAMEVLADVQLQLHCRERTDLCRHGVWRLVRHPKYV